MSDQICSNTPRSLRRYYMQLLAGFFSLGILCSGCETVVEFPLPDVESVITVNGLVQPSNIVYVNLTASKPVLETGFGFDIIADASVGLYEDNVFIDNLAYGGDGNYFFSTTDILTKEGHSYRLEIDAPDFNSITTETYIPNAAEGTAVFIDTVEYSDKTFLEFSFRFSDPGDEENFYFIDIAGSSIGNLCFGSFENDFVAFSEFFGDIDDGVPYYCGQQLFTDANFNGGQADVQLLIGLEELSWFPTPIDVDILFATVSKDYFHYQSSAYLQEINIDNPFSQPVTVYNNVENGLGNLSGLTMKRIDLDL